MILLMLWLIKRIRLMTVSRHSGLLMVCLRVVVIHRLLAYLLWRVGIPPYIIIPRFRRLIIVVVAFRSLKLRVRDGTLLIVLEVVLHRNAPSSTVAWLLKASMPVTDALVRVFTALSVEGLGLLLWEHLFKGLLGRILDPVLILLICSARI